MLDHELTMPEQVLLLSLDDVTGRMCAPYAFHAISAACLGELFLRGRLAMDPPNVKLIDARPVGDALLDRALARFAAEHKGRSLAWWVQNLRRPAEQFRTTLADGLVRHGVLTVGDETVLWVFHRQVMPTVDAGPEHALREGLRAALAAEGPVDARPAIVLGLLRASGALGLLVERSDVKAATRRADAVCEADPLAAALRDAVRKTIEEEQAAAASAATLAVS